ncbi:GAF and ANTAR domain-containing protein [uncultured Jatrophihabitans sp.]|uniref:GAF and ANTAR domain-containing protein n=1 Tax=uncultured Jatrophihabitans sp. TaxID=1610747 RepID=UPI0035CAD752
MTNREIPRASSADDDVAGLTAAVAGLAGLVADSGTIEQLLTEVASFAMSAVPGADGAGVTVVEAGRHDTIVASETFVRDVDAIQYRLGEGPCISAAATGSTNSSGALGEDASWPTFGPLAAELGVHSALSLPLVFNGDILGAINVYAHARDAFDGSSRGIGEKFAAPAAVAVHNALVLNEAQQTALRLETALKTRSTIDHAIGIVMSRTGVSASDAFIRLRIMSQHEHVKLAVVAQNLVQESTRRARARVRDAHADEGA